MHEPLSEFDDPFEDYMSGIRADRQKWKEQADRNKEECDLLRSKLSQSEQRVNELMAEKTQIVDSHKSDSEKMTEMEKKSRLNEEVLKEKEEELTRLRGEISQKKRKVLDLEADKKAKALAVEEFYNIFMKTK